MYQIIGHPMSRAFRLMWMLEELGQPYEIDPVSPQSEAARAINPSGKVPLLRDGDHLIADSVAASIYLADKHGQLTAPPGTAERAHINSLLFFILDEIEGPLWTKAKHTFVLPEKLRVDAVRNTATKEFDRGLANLAARLGDGPYLTGADFTFADVILGHCIGWAEVAKMNPPQDEKIVALFDAIRSRPAHDAAQTRRNRESDKDGDPS